MFLDAISGISSSCSRMYASELKIIVKGSGLPQWKIAESMGVSEATIYRKLRGNAEISPEFEKKMLICIRELQMQKEGW